MFDDINVFIWDKGNIDKNIIKHKISCQESEEIFLDENQVIVVDTRHSETEERKLIIGKTFNGVLLSVIFTIRDKKIRVISARRASKKEKKLYE